jgi:predicted signal transduction protein with EAL and GGDEF domain
MSNSAILCVDDEIIILESLREQLQRHFGDRYLYEVAESVEEAWEVIDELYAGEPLEILETMLMEDVDLARKILLKFQQMGMNIPLDDFGTGYSSLHYLQQFPFQTLKIDRSFVRHLRRDRYYIAIVDTLLILGRKLNIRVVAQGVETIEVKNILHQIQCHYMQGTWFHRPLPVQELTQILQADSQRFFVGSKKGLLNKSLAFLQSLKSLPKDS